MRQGYGRRRPGRPSPTRSGGAPVPDHDGPWQGPQRNSPVVVYPDFWITALNSSAVNPRIVVVRRFPCAPSARSAAAAVASSAASQYAHEVIRADRPVDVLQVDPSRSKGGTGSVGAVDRILVSLGRPLLGPVHEQNISSASVRPLCCEVFSKQATLRLRKRPLTTPQQSSTSSELEQHGSRRGRLGGLPRFGRAVLSTSPRWLSERASCGTRIRT